jgi:hypothetical protein
MLKSEDGVLVIPREANLRIRAEERRVVARVSQAVVAVASIDGSAALSLSFCLYMPLPYINNSFSPTVL